jgi:K+-transporting ATPase ATPase A chain
MTVIGWIQILLFCAIIVAITPVLGAYMTRVFSGQRTFLSPILRPVELTLYWAGGVEEKSEQGWLRYTVGMLLFHVGGFVILYALLRLQGVLWRPICRSTLLSASSPTPTGRTMVAKRQCRISCRCLH